MPKRKSRLDHDGMVRSAVAFLASEKFRNIRADLPDSLSPTLITWKLTGKGHLPDISAENGGFNLFEVETADSIGDGHTEDQWKLFAAHAENTGGKFWVVVPKASESAAVKRVEQLGIKATVWGV